MRTRVRMRIRIYLIPFILSQVSSFRAKGEMVLTGEKRITRRAESISLDIVT